MGGIQIIIYNKTPSMIDHIKGFLNIKHRGIDDTTITHLHTHSTNDLKNNKLSHSLLSKHELQTYKQHFFSLFHHRLIINDDSFNASQPFINNSTHLLCNGEIYNYSQLISEHNLELSSTCDVEIILPLYNKYKRETCSSHDALVNVFNSLEGDFAFILTENIDTFILKNINCFCAIDHFGIKPLYYVKKADINFHLFVSELKALPSYIISNSQYTITHVTPGTYWSFQNKVNDFIQYYSIDNYNNIENCTINDATPETLDNMYNSLQSIIYNNICIRSAPNLSSGILLSGGFDSCLLASLLIKYLVSINHDFINTPIHFFTIGQEDDLEYSNTFITFLQTKYNIILHHHIININNLTILEKDISNIIYILETYNYDTVKKAIPYYYLLKYINEHCNLKILYSGNGLNELGGYNKFSTLNHVNFQKTSIKLIQNMHKSDLLLFDRLSTHFNLEIRQPFVNKTLIEYMLSIHPNIKKPQSYSNNSKPITKYIIRKAFDKSIYIDEIMPYNCLWRHQSPINHSLTNFYIKLEQFFNNMYTTSFFNLMIKSFTINTPKTNAELYYRLTFKKYFYNRVELVQNEDLWNIV